jgi:hypothetical protein
MTRETLNKDIQHIYTEVADVQGMNLHISSYDIVGLNRSKGKIPIIPSGYLDLHCLTDQPSTLLHPALVLFEQ